MSSNPEENHETELTEAQLECVAGGNRPSMPRAGKETDQYDLADE